MGQSCCCSYGRESLDGKHGAIDLIEFVNHPSRNIEKPKLRKEELS
jgi:hypothetical protein